MPKTHEELMAQWNGQAQSIVESIDAAVADKQQQIETLKAEIAEARLLSESIYFALTGNDEAEVTGS